MPTELNATITVQEGLLLLGQPIWVMFTVTNHIPSPISVINPDVGTPPSEINWTFSNETYQISVLLSFHLIKISMIPASGGELPIVGPNPLVTPTLLPRLELAPGGSFTLRINLTDLFELQQPGKYHLTVEYGDDQARARAETDLIVKDGSEA